MKIYVLLGIFWMYFVYLDGKEKRQKKLSYVFTLAASVGASVGWVYAFHTTTKLTRNFILSSSDMSDSLLGFLQVCFCLDLVFGYFYYRQELQLLSGWIHHILYIAYFSFARAHGFSNGAAFLFYNEIPTVVLALGTIHPSLRSDWLFGVTFLLCRIVALAMTLRVYYREFTTAPDVTHMLIPGYTIFVLHCYWFLCWAQTMNRKLRKHV
jgi:hypothetical protein